MKILPTFFLFLGCNNNSSPKLRKYDSSPPTSKINQLLVFLGCPVYNRCADMCMHAVFSLLRRQALKMTKLRPEIIQQSQLCPTLKSVPSPVN